MKKLLLISLAILTVTIYSCKKKDTEETIDYTGTWSGLYLGNDDNGTWTATIDSNGDVSGSASSAVYPATYDLIGTIDPQGAFTATAGSASTGSEFVGQFTETTASGTWSNTNFGFSGTWSGTKELDD